jgi:hypothetical protein
VTRRINPSSAGRVWTWHCPVCNSCFGGSIGALSALRQQHLRSCTPPEIQEGHAKGPTRGPYRRRHGRN